MEEIEFTDVWQQYQRGVDYNRRKNIYSDTEDNYRFFHGDQWHGAKLGPIKPITLNIIKPIVKYKVAVIHSNEYQVVFNPNGYVDVEQEETMKNLCKVLNEHANVVWEREQLDRLVREAVKDSCINSEGCLHFYWQGDDLKAELINKTNIYYGNENSSDIQNQPYIILSFRQTVNEVRKEAIKNGLSEEEAKKIVADDDFQEQSGYENMTEEISDMCLVLLKYYKKKTIVVNDDGSTEERETIHSVKSTRTVVIQKEEDNKMTLYPIAHIVWEDVKGDARGQGEVKYNIANQIEINKTALRRAIAVKMGAYPKLIVNKENIQNSKALTTIGATIEIEGNKNLDDVRKQAGYLQPATMSADSQNLQTELMTDTKELAGAGDTVTGNIDPTKASGRAILAVQQANQQPLNEQLFKYKVFLEDCAKVMFDMWQTYSTNGIRVFIELDKDGKKIMQPFFISYEQLSKLKVNIKIDITPKSPYDKFSQEQSIENLLNAKYITFEEYVEALDDDSAMPKKKLEALLQKREENRRRIELMQQQMQQQQRKIEDAIKMKQSSNNAEIENIQSQMADMTNNVIGGATNEMQQLQAGGNESY